MVRRILDFILKRILIFIAAAITLTTIAQVVARYIVGNPLIWSESVARYLGIWLVMLGAGYVLGEKLHVCIEFLTDKLPPKGARAASVIAQSCIIIFSGFVTYFGVILTRAVSRQKIAALHISMSWMYAAVPIGAGLLGVYAVIVLTEQIQKWGKSS